MSIREEHDGFLHTMEGYEGGLLGRDMKGGGGGEAGFHGSAIMGEEDYSIL